MYRIIHIPTATMTAEVYDSKRKASRQIASASTYTIKDISNTTYITTSNNGRISGERSIDVREHFSVIESNADLESQDTILTLYRSGATLSIGNWTISLSGDYADVTCIQKILFKLLGFTLRELER